ncbi:uncharacterized protein B0I36DRAFT_57304 [Microdochium trichocladiopsis]|uniref:Uncharacterized protein n=1 Tax=Microdochium trichocladiopsis TaxID=1682393 RepID=A0A9P9BHA6_9PEZI|nr:uncharacterized protein B0I36DRAFT_57304 [Microdochium trichocladiopsis]KAH7010579.1 hypothetical protein B0I36DRAFT_57304 [Microdochium trichocladiopsis]
MVNNGVMPTVDPDIVSETGDSLGRNAEAKRRRLIQPSLRKPAAKITVQSARPHTKSRMLTCPSEQKKKQTKKAPPRGSIRHFPCRQCVARASKAPGHECASQNNTGAACWDCAKNGHTCRPVPDAALAAVRAFWDLNRRLSGADEEPDDAWRAAAQRAAQQLRACGSGAVPPATPRPAPALASFGEVAERSFKERSL